MLNEMIADYAKKRADSVENFIAAYINETGLAVNDIQLVEKRSDDGLKITWYCEPKNAKLIHDTVIVY